MRNQAAPNAETLERIRRAAIMQLHNMGVVPAAEMPGLLGEHVDDVLDRLFRHCGVVRVRISDSELLEIHPKGTVH
jgi:hypothetical protein